MDIIQKLNKIFNKKQKVRIFILIMMMVVGGILETITVFLMQPFMLIIVDESNVQKTSYLRAVYEYFNIESTKQFLIIIAITIAVLYIIKNMYLTVMTYVQLRFVYNNQMSISKELMNAYLSRPYEYYLSKSSAEIIRAVTSDTGNVFALVMCVLQMLTEGVITFFLIMTLIFVNVELTIAIIFLLMLAIIIISKVIKPRMRYAGINNMKYSAEMIKWCNQAITGIKDIKIAKRENYFLKNFVDNGYQQIAAVKRSGVYLQVPRLFIETVCMSGMMFVMAILLIIGNDMQSMLPVFATFVMAAMRLLPAANRMNLQMNQIVFLKPTLDLIQEDLDVITDLMEVVESEEKILKFDEKIEFSNITYKYPNTDKNLFKNASFLVPSNKSVALIGPSGSGKTTAVDIVLGLLKPQQGKILVDGVNIEKNYGAWLQQIGYIPQSIFMLEGSIRENVAFGVDKNKIDEKRIDNAIKDAQLGDFIESLPEGLDTEIGERGVRLSGGQRQRIGIARALYNNPSLLVFDEATSALDNETEAAVMEAVNKLQGEKTMIIIAHRLDTIKNCDIVYKVENGKIERHR